MNCLVHAETSRAETNLDLDLQLATLFICLIENVLEDYCNMFNSKVVTTHLWNTPLNLYQQAIMGFLSSLARGIEWGVL